MYVQCTLLTIELCAYVKCTKMYIHITYNKVHTFYVRAVYVFNNCIMYICRMYSKVYTYYVQ